MLVAGRAGIGKTRLTAELAERARARGATVLAGRCIQLVGTGLPYLPFVEALRPLRGSLGLAELAATLRELPRLIPELGPRARAATPTARDDSRLRLFEEVLARLRAPQRRRAGRPRARGPALGRRVDARPRRVPRPRDPRPADPARRDLPQRRGPRGPPPAPPGVRARRRAGAAPRCRSAALDATTSRRCSPPSGAALPPELRATIAERAEGNPFFARELLAAARARRDRAAAGAARRAARPTSRDSARRARGRARRGCGRARRLLRPARRRDAARRAASWPRRCGRRSSTTSSCPTRRAGTFRFRHALFADAVYETLLPGERELLHERLARALTDSPAWRRAAAAAEAAQHWAAAGRPVEALGASLQAAREAEAVSGLTEALGHVERVLELWDQRAGGRGAGRRGAAGRHRLGRRAGGAVGAARGRGRRAAARRDPRPGRDAGRRAVAGRLGVERGRRGATLEALEREGLVERVGDGTFRAARLAVTEARRLYPSVVVLESLAVRQSPRVRRRGARGLRAANARLRARSATRPPPSRPTTTSTAGSPPAAATSTCSPRWTRSGARCCATSASTWSSRRASSARSPSTRRSSTRSRGATTPRPPSASARTSSGGLPALDRGARALTHLPRLLPTPTAARVCSRASHPPRRSSAMTPRHRPDSQRRRHRADVRHARRDQGPARARPASSSGPATTGSTAPTTARTIRGFYGAGQEDTSRDEAFVDRRRRAGHPARHRHRRQPRRAPAARARRLPDDVAGLRRRRARRAAHRGRVRRSRATWTCAAASASTTTTATASSASASVPGQGRRAGGEAARGRRARAGALGGLRHGHQRRAGRRRASSPSESFELTARTEPGDAWSHLAESLAADFATRAAVHDREATFPSREHRRAQGRGLLRRAGARRARRARRGVRPRRRRRVEPAGARRRVGRDRREHAPASCC